MARIARVVVPGVPHHIIQRGNRRLKTFFCEADYRVYRSLISTFCRQHGVEIWAYCLMPNHVHLIAVPGSEDSIRKAFGEAHRRYTRHVNIVKSWNGHLWQGRFASYPMGDDYLITAARYVEKNPVQAGLSKRAVDYPWSSAMAHYKGVDDELVRVKPMLDMVGDWKRFLDEDVRQADMERFGLHEKTGRPLGSEVFINGVEQMLRRILQKQKPGRKRKDAQGQKAATKVMDTGEGFTCLK
ncbi:MAG TPA: transposase [Desulfomonilia bacterium]|nr:transposase [Desulfomonilia bacterium]